MDLLPPLSPATSHAASFEPLLSNTERLTFFRTIHPSQDAASTVARLLSEAMLLLPVARLCSQLIVVYKMAADGYNTTTKVINERWKVSLGLSFTWRSEVERDLSACEIQKSVPTTSTGHSLYI